MNMRQQRRVVLLSLVLSMAAIIFNFGTIALSFLLPTAKKNSYGGKVYGGFIDDLPEVGGEPKLFPQGRFWLVHDEHGITALHSSCTHLDCRFNWDQQSRRFVCPCHGSEFGRDGLVLRGPATRSLDRFPVSIITETGSLVRSLGNRGEPLPIKDLLLHDSTGPRTEEGKKSVVSLVEVDTGRKIPTSADRAVE